MNSLPVLFLRSLLFYTGYGSGTILMSSLFLLVGPFLPERGRYQYTATWCRWVLAWLKISCGVKCNIAGVDRLPGTPVVLVANHQSSWETLLFYLLVSPVAPILKKELLSIPFWGWALRLSKPIAIDRSKPREAGKSLLTQGVSRIREGFSIIVFPEGTRSSVTVNRKLSRGAAKLAVEGGVPILPVAHNAGHCWPPGRFLKYPGVITVVIGDPLPTDNQEPDKLTGVAEAWIRQQMSGFANPGNRV